LKLRAFALICILAAARSIPAAEQVTVTAQADSPGAVVWLTRLDAAKIEAGRQRRQLLQKHKVFSPHLLVVQVGSEVEFPNQDPFFHNVCSLYEGKRFDLGLYEAGSSRTVVFNRAGISYIFCNIHPEMSAVVVALKTPYYGVSDGRGTIAIPGVPPGRYEMKVWHERVSPETLNGLTRTIQISEVSSSLGVLHLPEQRNLSEPHKNKYGQEYDKSAPAGPIYTRP
jgi:plastocyanin